MRSIVVALVIGAGIFGTVGSAAGYGVGPAVPLEELARKADLVAKVTVTSDKKITDRSFENLPGFDVHEATMRVVSVVKGRAGRSVRFRYYRKSLRSGMGYGYVPQHYTLVVDRHYLVFAKGKGAVVQQLERRHTRKADQGVIVLSDAAPHRGKTVTDVVWAELAKSVASAQDDIVVDALVQLDELSGGRDMKLADYDRQKVLEVIRPKVLASSKTVATAAIGVFGAESPYFDDNVMPYWLAGVGKGEIVGLAARKLPSKPAASVAVKELSTVAETHPDAQLRALALRALGRSHGMPAPKLLALARDPDPDVRRAAVLVSAELADRTAIADAAKDPVASVRQAAALATGFTQDVALLKLLDGLLKDKEPTVRSSAALALLSFDPARSASVLRANLASDFRPLFVNALARRDAAPHVAMLVEVIEKRLQPQHWWGGRIPAADSWSILFDYIKARPAAELVAGQHDRSLDGLEKMDWFSSSEPRDLYALYVKRRLPARARKFRAAMKAAASFNMDVYFDQVDKNPEHFLLP